MKDQNDQPRRRRPAHFWWFLANLLAFAFALTSWLICLHVFGNPEIPRNYRILKSLDRLPEIRRFIVLDAPDGGVLGPEKVYSKFVRMKPDKLETLNKRLIRNYLTNYERPLGLTYVDGVYRIEQVRVMGEGDFFPNGAAVRARAMVQPDELSQPVLYPVLIDYLFPTMDAVPADGFRKGDLLEVKKSPNCATILHVAQIQDGGEDVVCATVVPIAYGPYRLGNGSSLSIEPPKEVSPGTRFPHF